VRVRSLATGLSDEAFLDDRGSFAQELELQPETDNALEFAVGDGGGTELARLVSCVRHQAGAQDLGLGVLPTQLITKPLQIEVLSRTRQRVKQVIAPVGATLPGVFQCKCRTHDQAGRVVVPIFEENRVIKQMVIDDLDPALPVGSPVEVELAIDVKHAISVQVRVRQSDGDRCETATIEAPPPPQRPTRNDIDELQGQIDELLGQFSGSFRTRLRARAARRTQQEAAHQDGAVPLEIACPPSEQEEAGKAERVGIDDPLQVDLGEVQPAADRQPLGIVHGWLERDVDANPGLAELLVVVLLGGPGGVGQAVAEVDAKRGQRAAPVVGVAPLALGAGDGQVEQLAGGVLGREAAARLDCLSDLAVERLYGVGVIVSPSEIGRVVQ